MAESPDANISDDEIQRLAAAGRKIEAIKRYRERTGVGLAEAKEAVEAITWGEEPRPPPSPESVDTNFEKELVDLLLHGKKIAAIKVYRERTGRGLKESKEAMEALAARHGLESMTRGGCLGMVLVLMVALTAMFLCLLCATA